MAWFACWFLALLAGGVGRAQTTLLTGLVGYWSFDEGSGTTVSDRSGTGNNGLLVNGGAGTWVAGHFGTALYFPGVTGTGSTRVEIPNATSLQITSAITFAAWVRVDDIARDAPILAKEGDTKLSYWFGAFGLNTEGAVPGNFGMLLDLNGTQGWEVYDRNQGSLTQGQWVHLASTWDGAQIAHYINGSVVGGGAAFSGTVNVSDALLAIGVNSLYNSAANATAFNGIIDDLYLYNRALSVTEINQLMAAPIPEPATTALLAGGLIFSGAIWIRRRRAAAT